MPMIGSWTSTSILNVAMSGLRTMSSSLLFSSRIKLLIGINNTKITKEVVWSLGLTSVGISNRTTFHSVVESKREEFRNLKQGSLSVYQYNIQFQKLARFTKQDVLDEKSMIYQFRGGSEKICNYLLCFLSRPSMMISTIWL